MGNFKESNQGESKELISYASRILPGWLDFLTDQNKHDEAMRSIFQRAM